MGKPLALVNPRDAEQYVCEYGTVRHIDTDMTSERPGGSLDACSLILDACSQDMMLVLKTCTPQTLFLTNPSPIGLPTTQGKWEQFASVLYMVDYTFTM
eukprot:1159257-Pelagomonas_calceolata.AAC.8